MQDLAKLFLVLGFILIICGALLLLIGKIPFLGKLPGDIYIKKENFTFYFPFTTMILVSIIVSAVANIFKK